MAYSQDIRERVIAAVEEEGLSRRGAGSRYRVPPSTVVNWIRAFRQSGRKKPRPMGGDRRSVLKSERGWIARLIAREKNLTLLMVSARLLAERHVKADPSMLSRFLRAEGFSLKKNAIRRRAKSP